MCFFIFIFSRLTKRKNKGKKTITNPIIKALKGKIMNSSSERLKTVIKITLIVIEIIRIIALAKLLVNAPISRFFLAK
ncbi:hypothetical protein ES703_46605 [subsurface metagenome]